MVRLFVRQLTVIPVAAALVFQGTGHFNWSYLAMLAAFIGLYAVLIDRQHEEVSADAAGR